jgi:transposase
MYYVLDKDNIMEEIVPYLSRPGRGPSSRVPVAEIVNAVPYKPKTGVQWRLWPVGDLFSGEPLHYRTVVGHYRKWCRNGSWKDRWVQFLSGNKAEIDLSSGDFDGSHTTAIRGGEQVEYQGGKRRRTTNALYLTDRQGLPLAMSEPIPGNHNDLYEIEVHAEEVFATLEGAGIATDGLFVNGDAGFDSEGFRSACANRGVIPNVPYNQRKGDVDRDKPFDEKLYQERYSVERTFAWTDSFRSVPDRFDTATTSWKGFNFLAFIVIAIKKFKKSKNSR